MDFEGKRFVIGIDLGTTNSAVSYVDLYDARYGDKSQKPRINIFRVPQLAGAGEVAPLSILPSFLYIPGEYDVSKESITLPWKTDSDNFAGTFARDHGSKVPSRLISSAKSWLCHSKADRNAKILPWGSGKDVAKISPVDTTCAYLKHVRKAWNYSNWNNLSGNRLNKNDSNQEKDAEELYLENQVVIITVPASFDEIARDLTVEAAKKAGIHTVTLIEEPLAAFYSWLIKNENSWSEYVKPNDLILVCDVGGGTTDFTLITLRDIEGTPRFERLAVGDHLILGGDNIDLALARYVETKFKGKNNLNADRWKALCHKCREAKEMILNQKTDSVKITLMGEGSSLISGTLSAVLKKSDLEKIMVDGFFPFVDFITNKDKNGVRKGITEFGLPYEQEPAITKHLGRFLENHKEDVKNALGKSPIPDLILFNGGSLKADIVQDRIKSVIRHWFEDDNDNDKVPIVLLNPDPDLAVALGASYYGLVKTGNGVKVGSGSPRAYYLGISHKADTSNGTDTNTDTDADIGMNIDKQVTRQAICLVERGLDEGSKIELSQQKFEVITNQPVGFEVLSSSYRSGDKCGDLIIIDDTLTPLPSIQTVVKFGKKGVKNQIPICMEAEYTELGTLALWCRSLVSNHRWQLQFQLRKATTNLEITDNQVFDEQIIKEIKKVIEIVFSKDKNNEKDRYKKTDKSVTLSGIVKTITNIIEQSKEKWPLGLIRVQADELIKYIGDRKDSAEQEARWLNLVGFCMRPGFGDAFDEHRIRSLWKIYKTGTIFKNNLQAKCEWWILWRRLAGGLKPGQQRQFIQDLTPIIIPKKNIKVKIAPQERVEIWMAVANMERLSIKDKIVWGKKLLSEMKVIKPKPQHFWVLSRIGAREPLYGSIDRVLPVNEVSKWIKSLLSKKWNDPKSVGQALICLGRKTGDRTRDIEPALTDEIIQWLDKHDDLKSHFRVGKKALQEVMSITLQEEKAMFGESLPSGIILAS